MKEQYLVTSNSRSSWRDDVNHLLKQGWMVVPGTLSIATSSSAVHNRYNNNQLVIESQSEFAVVLEREVPQS